MLSITTAHTKDVIGSIDSWPNDTQHKNIHQNSLLIVIMLSAVKLSVVILSVVNLMALGIKALIKTVC